MNSTLLILTVRIAGILADLMAELIVISVTIRKTLHIRGNLPTDGMSKLPSVSGLILRDGGSLLNPDVTFNFNTQLTFRLYLFCVSTFPRTNRDVLINL